MIRILDEDDLPRVTAIHLPAFSESAISLLGRDAVSRYYQYLMQNQQEAFAVGIFYDGTLAGYCFAGVFNNYVSGFLIDNGFFLGWQIFRRPWVMFTPLLLGKLVEVPSMARSLFGSLFRKKPSTIRKKSFGIMAIAICPQYQGLGLGKQLMAEVERIAEERGFDRIRLSVRVENSEAIQFYENLGWRKKLSSEADWQGVMTKQL